MREFATQQDAIDSIDSGELKAGDRFLMGSLTMKMIDDTWMGCDNGKTTFAAGFTPTSDKNWTIAWRTPGANRFLRYSNLAVSWNEAVKEAAKLRERKPELEVWYTTTREHDDAHQNEDSHNILVESGRRVRVIDTPHLPE